MELVTPKTNDLLTSTQLVLSKYYESKYLTLQRNEYNQVVCSNNTKFMIGGQAYLDFIIDASVNYVLQIKLEQQQGQDKFFYFGLMSDTDKDSIFGFNEYLCYCEQSGIYGLNTLIKGIPILTDDKSLVSRSLEVRINIDRKILKVGSLPYYDSVVQVDKPENIEPATPYRFFLWGLQEGCKMTIMKLETVSQFDNLM